MSQNILGKPSAVLFDLDGTLVDTAPDLAAALNATLANAQLPPLPYNKIRPIVSNGVNGLIELGFGNDLKPGKQQALKSYLIDYYQQHIADESALFKGISELLAYLEHRQVPWGIVTNKSEHLTMPLLKALKLNSRAACVVCGDQVKTAKPHPESIYLACKQINVEPIKAAYVGDAQCDIKAGQLAGLTTIACAYGYIQDLDNILTWQADIIINSTNELLELFK